MILHPAFVLPVMSGETPVGYASRLALRFDCSLRAFCSRVKVPLQGLLDGVPTAVAALQAVCSLPDDTFADTTYSRAPGRRFVLAGETFSIDQVNRRALRICPACVEEQFATVSKVHEVWLPKEWHINPLHVCDEHSLPLLTVDIPRYDRQDFAAMLLEGRRRGALVPSNTETVLESGLGRHIRQRLRGETDEHWLSRMPLHAAIKTAEMIGSAATRGVHTSWINQSHAQRFEAGRIGFDLLKDGEEGLRALFDQLQSKAANKDGGEDGLVSSFGRLHVTLSASKDGAFDPLKDVLRRHVVETMPFGVGEIVLGQKVKERRMHSARTVAPELGVSVPTAERRLRFIGLLEHIGTDANPSRSTFDARTHADVVRRLGSALQRAEAGRYLGLKVVYEDVAQILDMVGSMNIDKTRLIDQIYARDDLDGFLASVLGKASPEPASSDFEPLARASKRSRIGMAAILDMIRRGDISDVRLSSAHKGIMSVMVRKADVLSAAVAARSWVTLTSAAKTLKMRDTTLSALVHGKVIPSKGASPVMLQPADLDVFSRTYVSKRDVTRRYRNLRGRSNRSVTNAISAAGLAPALDEKQSRVTFFRRDEVLAALGPPPP